MYGANVGLEIGKRSLLAQQYSLNLTGHNIANVNTPGYTRQQSILNSSQPYSTPQANFGTGVELTEVRRLRSYFLDDQFRQESQSFNNWQTLSQTWGQIERIYAEPSETGLSSILDEFWNSWQDLAANPESMSARISVREQAGLLANGIQHMNSQLIELQRSIDDDIMSSVNIINNISDQIASLNDAVMSAELSGSVANDLRDRRDYLVDELSQYVNVSVNEQPNGTFTVFLGSMAIVDGVDVSHLNTTFEQKGEMIVHNVGFLNTSASPEINNGALAALIESRDQVIEERIGELDKFSISLVENINAIHQEGYTLNGDTGIDFFDKNITGAGDIKVSQQVLQNEGLIAASRNGEVGDNSNALRLAALRSELVMNGGNATFNDFYNSEIGVIGIRSQEAQNLAANQESLVFHIENNRQSIQGVSLDEEMANMIRYEHAYAAAARVITVMDEALNTVINGMGLVGR